MVRGAVFPVGVVTSFVGIPFFLFLILTRRERRWSR
jgi:iron complex transport system permease protein